jgi:hypothetical protein
MDAVRILGCIFVGMAGYGLGTGLYLPTAIAMGMVVLMWYGNRVLNRKDAEWDRLQALRQNITHDSKALLGVHECESATGCACNSEG